MRAENAVTFAVLLVATLLAGCDPTDAVSQDKNTAVNQQQTGAAADVPRGWVRREFGGAQGFSLAMPVAMVEVPVQPIDSLVGQFRSAALDLSFDYGLYASPLQEYLPDNASIETITVDGRATRLVSTQDVVAAHVPAVHAGIGLTVYIMVLDAQAAATARRIVESIRFAPPG